MTRRKPTTKKAKAAKRKAAKPKAGAHSAPAAKAITADARLADLIGDLLETEAGIAAAKASPPPVTTVEKPQYDNPADQRAAEYLSGAKPSVGKVKVIDIETDGTSPALQMARSFLSPVALNAIVAETFIDNERLDLNAALKVVRERAEKVIKCDMSDLESTLVGNISALDAIFGTVAVYAQAHLKANKLAQFEMLMRVAFKAQSQLRCSVDSLAEIKNPKPIFAKNLNVANGNQQVNSTTGPQQINNSPSVPEAPPRAETQEPLPTNKLLETA